MLRLLLLSAILAAPAMAAVNEPLPATMPIAAATAQSVTGDQAAALDATAQQASRQKSDSTLETRSSSEICYKIRAYIFKRDDDHAPEYVGSTTCGPKAPRAKSVDGIKPRLVPAN